MVKPGVFIERLRESFSNSVEVYTQGSCYQLFLILRSVYEDAEAYYDNDHIITRIGDKFYDITGQVSCNRHIPLKEYGRHYYSKLNRCRYED